MRRQVPAAVRAGREGAVGDVYAKATYIDLLLREVAHGHLMGCCPLAHSGIHVNRLHANIPSAEGVCWMNNMYLTVFCIMLLCQSLDVR